MAVDKKLQCSMGGGKSLIASFVICMYIVVSKLLKSVCFQLCVLTELHTLQ